MIKRMKKIIFQENGNIYPLTIAIAIAILLLLLVVGEYMKLMIISGGVKDAFEEAIISVVNDNYNEVYHCVREGYAAGYEPNGDETFYESLDTGDVKGRLKNLLGMKENGSYLEKINNGSEKEFSISEIDVHIHNAPMVRSDEDFYAEGTLKLKIPIRFVGKILTELPIRLKVKAELNELF